MFKISHLNAIYLLLCICLFSFSCMASSPPASTVYDYAGLLTAEEKQDLKDMISTLKTDYEIDPYIVLISDAKGKSSEKFANGFFGQLGYGNDKTGILLLIDMDNRNVWISTSGKAISYFPEERIQSIIDDFFSELANGNYCNVGKIFLNDVTQTTTENMIPVAKEKAAKEKAARSQAKAKRFLEFDKLYGDLICFILALIFGIRSYMHHSRKYDVPSVTKLEVLPDESSISFTSKVDRYMTSTIHPQVTYVSSPSYQHDNYRDDYRHHHHDHHDSFWGSSEPPRHHESHSSSDYTPHHSSSSSSNQSSGQTFGGGGSSSESSNKTFGGGGRSF